MLSESICLAMIMWGEARGEGNIGMIATAYTAIHRSEHKDYPKNICGVMRQPYQYDFMTKRLPSSKDILPLIPLAEKVLKREIPDPTRGAKWFHTKSVNPIWAKNKPIKIAIGNHIFY